MTAIPSHYWPCHCGSYNDREYDHCPQCGSPRKATIPAGTCEAEAELHDKIEAYCREHDLAYVHSRMDKASRVARGIADYVIFAPGGRTLIIELKSKTGKQTSEQRGFQMQIEKCGHAYHLLRSYPEFLNLL